MKIWPARGTTRLSAGKKWKTVAPCQTIRSRRPATTWRAAAPPVRNTEEDDMGTPTRYGTPGGLNFPYFVDALSEKFIVYAPTMEEALQEFTRQRPGQEPFLGRQMADNE